MTDQERIETLERTVTNLALAHSKLAVEYDKFRRWFEHEHLPEVDARFKAAAEFIEHCQEWLMDSQVRMGNIEYLGGYERLANAFNGNGTRAEVGMKARVEKQMKHLQ